MDVTLYGLYNITSNYIRTKIGEGLTPPQKKVVVFATAYFLLAIFVYFVFRCFWQTSEQTSSPDDRRKGHRRVKNGPESDDRSSIRCRSRY